MGLTSSLAKRIDFNSETGLVLARLKKFGRASTSLNPTSDIAFRLVTHAEAKNHAFYQFLWYRVSTWASIPKNQLRHRVSRLPLVALQLIRTQRAHYHSGIRVGPAQPR
jgi:hypothetical protein